MVLLIGLFSAFFGAIGNVYLKKIFDYCSSRESAPLNFLFNFLVLLIFAPLFYYFKISYYSVFLLIIIVILELFCNYFFYKSIEMSDVSYVSVFFSLAPIFTLLITTMFISTVSIKTIIAVFGIVISVYFLNLSDKHYLIEPIKNVFRNKNYYGLIVALLSGCSSIIIKLMFDSNFINPLTLYLIRSFLLFLLFWALFKPKKQNINKKVVLSVFARALFIIVCMLLYYYAISIGDVVIATTASNTTAAFVLVLSYFLFNEKITKQKVLSVVSITLYIVMLSF